MHGLPRLPITCLILFASAAAACSGSETPAAQERCLLDGVAAHVEGRISNDDATYSLDLSRETITGTLGTRELFVNLGAVARSDKGGAPLLMRIFDAHSRSNLLDQLAEATASEPLTLQVFDASTVAAGSQNRTELADYDCGISQGSICVQLGFDSSGDELILDDDDGAYNGIAGTVTIESVDNVRRKIHITWDVSLGTNLLAFQDQSTGAFEGCLYPTYSQGSDGRWNLR